jgi:chemotaxis protein methyltransferase CheR
MSEKPKHFDYVRKLAKERAHLEIGEQSSHVVAAGLAHIRQARGYASNDEVVNSVKQNPSSTLTMHVVESMTTNETSFFRDPQVWQGLREHLIPELIEKRRPTRRISIWSAAAASGQEAFSLAILLREHFPELSGWSVTITASDISREMVQRIRQGFYSDSEIARGMPPKLRDKYFHKTDAGYQANDCIRNMVRPQRINLASSSLLLPKFDLVLVRNVLIYFDVDNKREFLNQVRECMQSWTPLILGAGETTINVDDDFVATDHGSFRCFSLSKKKL